MASAVVPEIIPVHAGPTDFRWTAQDLWFGMVNDGDPLSDMAIARSMVPMSVAE